MKNNNLKISSHNLTDICRDHSFYFTTGPWRNTMVQYGYDPRNCREDGDGNGGDEKSSSSASSSSSSSSSSS